MSVTVLSTDAYEAQEFDAVLVREAAIICLRPDEDLLRMIPLDKVNHVDADPDQMIPGTMIPESFHGGGKCAFVDLEQFPDLAEHMEEIDREAM